MGKLKQDLFQLIKSLDRNEKGYFKKYTLLHSGNSETTNNYTRLFDAIDSMEEYDEAELKKKFKGEKFIVQLHVTKNYLYSSILKSLRNYSSQASDNSRILSNIQDADLLIRKGHYEKAIEYIQATRQFAYEREFWGNVIELVEMERLIYNVYPKDDSIQRIFQLNSERAEIINIMKEEQELIDLSHKAKARTLKYGHSQPKKELKKFTGQLKKKLFDPKKQAKTAYAKNLQSTLKVIYYWLTEEPGKNYAEAVADFHRLKQHTFAIQKNPFSLYNKATNLGASMLQLHKYRELNALLKEIPEFEHRYNLKFNSKLRGFILEKTTDLNLVYFINSRQFERGVEYLKPAMKEVELHKKEMAKHAVNSFHYFSAVLYISAGHYKEAIKSLNQILVFNTSPIHPDMALFAKYLLVIAHYELGNRDVFGPVNTMFTTEEEIEPLHFLRSGILRIQNRKEEKVFFTEFKKRLLKSKNKQMLQKYFDFQNWTESKIQNKAMEKMTMVNPE